MKKILLTTLGLATGFGAFAQLPVSQTAENKHAILEEFTGLYCTFCPDGHAIGETIATANPDTYHRIHIHAGGYATPGANDPDMRTAEGTAIANASGLSGYPAGGTNRMLTSTTWAEGRGSWTAAAATVHGQASYVNLSLEGNVDKTTRQLTVDVEIFYTGTAPTANQYLTVALLQSNILGHQTDGGNFFPQGWKCQDADIYKHAHVLRMLLNTGGTSGDAVATATGMVVTKQYVVTLPAAIAGVDLELGELDLVGFITEANTITTPIVSGNDGPVTVINTSRADLKSDVNHVAPTGGLCDGTFIPKMTVTNNSNVALTGMDLSYIVNGTPTTVNLPAQAIAANGSYTHTFATTTLSGGVNKVEYDASLTDAAFTDLDVWNNTSCPDYITVIPAAAFGTTFVENFEGPNRPANAVEDIDAGSTGSVFPVTQAASSSVSWDLGAYENSATSYLWNFYGINSGVASIIWEKVDLSTATNHVLSFDHAYAQYTNENDRLQIFVSTDCGGNWTSVFNKAGATLMTHAPVGTGNFFPHAADWTSTNIDLSAYDGQNEVMIKFTGTSAYGNNLYVDNVNLNTTVGINENGLVNSVSVFPNPTTNVSIITFNVKESANVKVEIFNSTGSLVQNESNTLSAGSQKVTFDGSKLPNGIYFVNITTGDQSISKKISLLK